MKRKKTDTMRKWSLIFFAALAIIMAGCVKNVAPIEPVVPDNVFDNVVYSDVPIEFGYGGMTKAEVETVVDGMLFGVFPVLAGTDDLGKKPDLGIKENSVLRYVDGVGFKFGYSSEDRVFYYPDSDEKYKFYAYYSHQNDSLIRAGVSTDDLTLETQTKTYYHMRATGGLPNVIGTSGDVLWGKALAYNEQTQTYVDELNADVVRESSGANFVFEHPMARISFKVTLDPSSKDYLAAKNCMVKFQELRLMNSPYEADLCIIDLENNPSLNMEGKFENIKTSDDESKAPWLRGRTGTRTLNCEMTPEDAGVSQVVGQGDMIIVPQNAPLVCRVFLERYSKNSDGTYRTSRDGYWKYDITLNPDDYLDPSHEMYGRGYQAGVTYKYNIIVGFRYMTDVNDGLGKHMPYVKGVQVKR